jgi:hypothetical protein
MNKDENLKRGVEYINKFSELIELINDSGSGYIFQYQDIDSMLQIATQEDKPKVYESAVYLHSASIQLKTIAENILIRIEATKDKVPTKDKASYDILLKEAKNIRSDGVLSGETIRTFLIALNTYLVNTEMSEVFQYGKSVVMKLGGD